MITPTEFLQRRQQLFAQMGNDAIAIVPAAAESTRNGDNTYPYRQNSDFYYLTGFTEPDAIAIFSTNPQRFILFNRKRDPAQEVWHGPHAGQEGAIQQFGATEAYPLEDFERLLPELLSSCTRVFHSLGQSMRLDRLLAKSLNRLREKSRSLESPPQNICDIAPLLHSLRLFKSPAEIELMRKAAKISAQAHIRAMQTCRSLQYEYELEAEILHEFTRHGSRSPAYPCIVGAGANACTLHYTANNAQLQSGDLVLIDAGAEYEHYAADITRTFPVNGKFTPAQQALYELVLQAQCAGIEQVKPGSEWPKIQEAIVQAITAGLLKLGILQGTLTELLANHAYKRFYMHSSGHWLGLDVHDVGRYQVNGVWRQLQPGMVLTVEPGIYIPASEGVDPKWYNIGIRIEDDVLVTETGHEVLSAAAPKTIAEIEALMATA